MKFIALLAKWLGGIGVAVFVGACAYLYFAQDHMIFRPVPTDKTLAEQWRSHRVEIRSADVAIEGWWIDNPASKSQTVILYFGGNLEDVLRTAVNTGMQVDARHILASNYRGYGGTQGKPSEASLYQDALAVYDYAISQSGVHATDIVAVGRSLGSGIATYVAANRVVRGVVLITPYDSIVNVAQEMYPLLPIKWIVRNPFHADAYAAAVNSPVLILAGDQDSVIPAKHAQRLFAVWAGPKHMHVLAGVGHNNMSDNVEYYPLLNQFLTTLQ
jgi:pimeloyl-ACP methyl ester carboxylesterase